SHGTSAPSIQMNFPGVMGIDSSSNAHPHKVRASLRRLRL
ncbi:MAG: hypothetical protein QOD49_906, partial [Actinomycetota bacterium]|nr:hypothetical protein [Actinomycetota bacterium]